jgi:hypothetical protein
MQITKVLIEVSIHPARISSEDVVRGALENNREHTVGIFSNTLGIFLNLVRYNTEQIEIAPPSPTSY